ncbi:hypothetical protein [Paenibacillus amylolyticus]|uniref:hypothetical protein n=1 Tax=Paenibacillus amylolyticus TaxID=1451 RepID=UPI0033936AD8
MNDLGELNSNEVIQLKTALLGRIDLLQERIDFWGERPVESHVNSLAELNQWLADCQSAYEKIRYL